MVLQRIVKKLALWMWFGSLILQFRLFKWHPQLVSISTANINSSYTDSLRNRLRLQLSKHLHEPTPTARVHINRARVHKFIHWRSGVI